ncbi:hypothetical protein O3M35_013074 [Rhynocoris fuscipes]|uniref:Proline dehydrogenase n=1 Tax=Rhynocoris fuscipes TaxID=488301 RepID=A0AAW1CJQ3_9HEMI
MTRMKEDCKESSESDEDLFNNSEEAFRSKTFVDLIRGYFVFLMCSSSLLVNNSGKLMKVSERVLGNNLFSLIMRMTAFGHFVGGVDKAELDPKLALLRKYGVGSILDYAAEEDISRDEAVEKEMKAAATTAVTTDLEELGGKLQQYKPSKQFADRREKVSTARVYFYENEEMCERNADNFIESIKTMAGQENSFVAVKLTALARPELLYLLSEVIARARKFAAHITGNGGTIISQHLTMEELVKNLENAGVKDTEQFLKHVIKDKDGVLHLIPWSGIINNEVKLDESFRIPSLTKRKMVPLISKLPEQEMEMFRNAISRLKRVVTAADECDVSVMIDAEQTYFQPAISRITMELMYLYNKEKPIIFNTYQSYLKQSFNEMSSDLEQSERQNFNYAFKLVRGAYLIQERERAKELRYPDPTNESFDKTTEMLNKIITHTFEKINTIKENETNRKIYVVIATHNEDTVKFAMDQMQCYNICKEDKVISFAQLLGMCDYITYPLGRLGYPVYKYVPYGPINKVVPYLVRRCQENIGVLNKLKKEKKIILQEIIRRIIKGKIFYKP